METLKTITDLIKLARNNTGLTQVQLADKLGVASVTISKWENGKQLPRIEELNKLIGMASLSIATSAFPIIDASPKPSVPCNEELTASMRKIKGKIYVDGKALDTLACQLRDRLNIEYEETDPSVLSDVKEALHECLRIYEDHEVKQQLA